MPHDYFLYHPGSPSNYEPDEADRYVLVVLYKAGFMLEKHFRALYNLSKSSVSDRLNRLVDSGLVERKKPESGETPSRVPFIYQITKSAHRYLLAPADKQVRRYKPLSEQQLNSTTISHPLAVAELAVALLSDTAGELPSFDWWGEHRGQMRLAITPQHPQSESLVQPDGVIRLLAGSSATWMERHLAHAASAWWVEVDRGTEDQSKWVEKIARYARTRDPGRVFHQPRRHAALSGAIGL